MEKSDIQIKVTWFTST